MLETVDYVVGAVLLGSGMVIGRRMRPRPPKPPAPLKLECTCGHGYGTHGEPGTADAGCSGRIKLIVRESSSIYIADVFEWVDCRCKRYDGPGPELVGWSV